MAALTRLQIYNDALMFLGERALASLTENREPRYLLDNIWNKNGIKVCLEAGQWFFAMRTEQIDYDPGIEPTFGYNRAFQKPTDWVLTSAVCEDEFFQSPLLRYNDEAGYWFSDIDTIYVRYVSDDAVYGSNLALWPDSFAEFVAAHFASKIAPKLANSFEEAQKVLALRKMKLTEAKNKCAMADPTQFPARGKWVLSRKKGRTTRDGGNSNGPLIG
jgi:hypothetical protein